MRGKRDPRQSPKGSKRRRERKKVPQFLGLLFPSTLPHRQHMNIEAAAFSPCKNFPAATAAKTGSEHRPST